MWKQVKSKVAQLDNAFNLYLHKHNGVPYLYVLTIKEGVDGKEQKVAEGNIIMYDSYDTWLATKFLDVWEWVE